MRLEGKVAVITGGGAGLGRDASLLFASEGAKIVAADIDAGRAEDTAKAVAEAGGEAVAVKCDVSVKADVQAAVDLAVSTYGKLDVMYNNAGIANPGFGQIPFEELDEASIRRVLDVNLLGVIFGCQAAVGPMRENGGGAIVNTSSAAALMAYPGFQVYGASKGGVNALTRFLACELGPFNIRVNTICPTNGMSANFLMPEASEVVGMSYEEAAGEWDPMATRIPLKVPRPPSLRDNAYAALWLASDESAYMSGVCFPTCDGGALSMVSLMVQ